MAFLFADNTITFKITFLSLLAVNLHSDITAHEQKSHPFFNACHTDAVGWLFTGKAL